MQLPALEGRESPLVTGEEPEGAQPEQLHRIDDICSLESVSEAVLLRTLGERYARDTIYTRISQMILVAANPYKELADAYSEQRLREYAAAGDPGSMPPHVFGLTRQALQEMASGMDQAVIISGESGAGKTETAKLILRALTAGGSGAGGGEDGAAQDLLLRAGPALEAFGNAATVRNANSSRFGKWLDVFLAPQRGGGMRVCGCALAHYLLETTRVCARAPGERNFHVFHQLLAGPPELLRAVGLRPSASEYRCLRPAGGLEAGPGVVARGDAEGFEVLRASLAAFGIEGAGEQAVLGVLGAVLELGNLDFGAAEGAEPAGEPEGEDLLCLERCAALLGVGAAELSECLRLRRLGVTGNTEEVPMPARQARAARDSLARHLYGSLFGWLLGRINARLRPTAAGARSFGILDMAGFEDFERNSLEQLLINSSNEWLQQAFNECVIKAELEDCRREGILVDGLDSFEADNVDCLELIGVTAGSMHKSPGILDVLEDTAALPKIGDPDGRFVAALVKQHGARHGRFKAPRFGGAKFTVRHFAGDIEYTCSGWVEKSTDRPPERAVELLAKSRDALVRALGAGMQGAHAAESGRRKAPSSIVRPFRASLRALMEKIGRFDLRFVRCIKPNDEGAPGSFRAAKVVEQLRCGGILEAVRIRKSGYRFRWPHAKFAARFACCAAAMAGATGGGSSSSSSSAAAAAIEDARPRPPSSAGDLVGALRSAFGLAAEELVMGTSKVLARERAAAELEGARSRLCRELAQHARSALHVQRSRRLLLELRAAQEARRSEPAPPADQADAATPAGAAPAAPRPQQPAEPAEPPPPAAAARPPEPPAAAGPPRAAAAAPQTSSRTAQGAGFSSLRARFERSAQRGDAKPAPPAPPAPRPAPSGSSGAVTARWRSVNQSSNQKEEAKREVAAALQSGEKAALEQAVRRGEAAGLDAQDLMKARTVISKLRQQDTAREVLARAVEARDEALLANAIARCDRAGLGDEDLRVAKEVRQELWREAAARRLALALRERDAASLKEALRRAELVGLAAEEVGRARRLLRELDVLAGLQQAMLRDNQGRLRELLEEAQALGVDGARLITFRRAAVLARLDELQVAITLSLEDFRAAIEAAEALGLLVQRPRQLYSALELLRDAVASRHRPALQTAVEAAERHGASEGMLAAARQALREESRRLLGEAVAARTAARPRGAESQAAETCAICLEESEVLAMPCCGRTATSNVLCPACAETLQRCPFCRAVGFFGDRS